MVTIPKQKLKARRVKVQHLVLNCRGRAGKQRCSGIPTKERKTLKHFKIKFEDLILFEDENYVLVNKPPFLSTLEDRNEKVNLLRLARAYTPGRTGMSSAG